MPSHIFIDNSNIFGGAQRTAQALEPGAVELSVRVYYKNLFALLEDGREVKTRVLAGSISPGNDQLWDYARKYGYNIDLLRKVEDNKGRSSEQSVDEMLHLRIANALLDYDPPQTLVIASGDGQENNRDASFPLQIQRALKRGWDVEVYSWDAQLSGNFRRMASNAGGHLVVRILDPYYRALTFIKDGQHVLHGASILIAGRVVAPQPK
jgi:hypothetical protein